MLSVLSVMMLGVLVNWLAAALLAFTIFFYAVIYTMWLKRWTPQNIVIGGAAGAFPPVIGWAAATGTVGIESVVLFLIIFLWTPPHFWALALFKSGDYARAGMPMMPNVAGEASTARQIFAYAVLVAAGRRAALVPRLCRRGLRHRSQPCSAPASSWYAPGGAAHAARPTASMKPGQGAVRLFDALSLRHLRGLSRRRRRASALLAVRSF